MKKIQLIYIVGRPFSPFYSLLMRFRAGLYRTGVMRVNRVQVPVISVGNLTMGGSGKTPVVQYLARFLRDRGWKPAVISRGYGGMANNEVNIVSDGHRVMLDARLAGDEPQLLAETLPGVPVLTGKRRKHPAAKAVDMGADILLLDDGFQHIGMGRDVDLVLFNADFLAGNSRVFPGGDLREPVKALNRCDAFVISGICDRNRERAERFTDLLHQHFPEHPVFHAGYRPSSLLHRDKNGMLEEFSLETVKNMKLFGFCGIAHPENFNQTLKQLGAEVSGLSSFPDHHHYSREDLDGIFQQADRLGADGVITTEKDMVRLALKGDSPVPLYVLRMEVEFDNDFKEFLLAKLHG